MNVKNLRTYVYVCPFCINPVEDCTCERYPMKLVQIDRKIWPIIKILNEKWYVTEDCCEGHIDGNAQIHILFARRYRFGVPFPKGFSGGEDFLRANITGATPQAKQRKKRQLLHALYDWACALENRRPECGFVQLRDF